MIGGVTWWNYLRSDKWQDSIYDKKADKSTGEVYFVPKSTLKWSRGFGIDGWLKGLFGQRKYIVKKN